MGMQTEEAPKIKVTCGNCRRFLMYVGSEILKEKVLANHLTRTCGKLKRFDRLEREKVEQKARTKREQKARARALAKREQTTLF